MKISNTFMASLAVVGLVVFSIFADLKAKEKVAVQAQKAVRKEVVRMHKSAWGLASIIEVANAKKYLKWTETLRVPLGTIPIGPSGVPGGADAMRDAVEALVGRLAGSSNRVSRSTLVLADGLGPWQKSDELDGRFCVVSTSIRNARHALTQPIASPQPAAVPKVAEAFDNNELDELLSQQTDFMFADFHITRETENGTKTDHRFRLWFDYQANQWREFGTKSETRHSLDGKWAADIPARDLVAALK